jgi:8-oxo-dGTP diphosphatase
MGEPPPAPVHVVAGVVRDVAGRVLIAQRPEDKPFAGLWEFPGGKLEPGEAPEAALARELAEEVGIEVLDAVPFMQVPHTYPERRVLLDVWCVRAHAGTAHGREGQAIAWVEPADLPAHAFPAANRGIVAALRLPDRCLVTPALEGGGGEAYLAQLAAALDAGIRLVQLRPGRTDEAALALMAEAVAQARAAGATVVFNGESVHARAIGADGLHLSRARLLAATARPVPESMWLSAACHDREALDHAVRIGADFVLVSPVLPTASHPGVPGMGWEAFAALVAAAPMPVFALGGVGDGELIRAQALGARGVAGIRGFWNAGRE